MHRLNSYKKHISGWGLEKNLRKRKVAALLDQADGAILQANIGANPNGHDIYSAENVLRYVKRRKSFWEHPKAQIPPPNSLTRSSSRSRSIDITFSQTTCHERLFSSLPDWTIRLPSPDPGPYKTSVLNLLAFSDLHKAVDRLHDIVWACKDFERGSVGEQALSPPLPQWKVEVLFGLDRGWPLCIPLMIYTVMKLRDCGQGKAALAFLNAIIRGRILTGQQNGSLDLLCKCLRSLSLQQMEDWTTRVRDIISGHHNLSARSLAQEPSNVDLVIGKFIWSACASIFAADDDDLLATLARLKERTHRIQSIRAEIFLYEVEAWMKNGSN